MKITVTLNGMTENPYLKMGLTRNPFPQIPRAEYMAASDALNRLAAEPLSGPEDIRKILEPVVRGEAGEKFIALCCANFKLGEVVMFGVTFPE